MSIAFDSTSARPSREDIEPVALDLIRKRGEEVLAGARRYASTPDDAEDAYQRALEILLTKAPTTREDELLPWLKTVVRHECFALRKKRERDVPVEHDELDAFSSADSHAADVRAERYDRLRVGAEALGRLKPHETKALLLKAEGMSYQEIAAQTGWSYTKVNRCLTEGRRAFYARVQRIESGAECERLDPLLSAMADGEASAKQIATVQPHLRGCLSCKAKLRDYREAPVQVRDGSATLAAAGALSLVGGRVWSALRSLFEAATAQKAAVVAASSVAVIGGGAATIQVVEPTPERRPAHRAPAPATRIAAPVAAPTQPAVNATAVGRRSRMPAKPRRKSKARPASPAPRPAQQAAKPAAEPRPTATPAAPARPAPQPPAPTAPSAGGGARSGAGPSSGARSGGVGAGEFGP